MATAQRKERTEVLLEQNYKVVEYKELCGIKGFITWWSTIKADRTPEHKDLVINTMEKYDRIIVNGNELLSKPQE